MLPCPRGEVRATESVLVVCVQPLVHHNLSKSGYIFREPQLQPEYQGECNDALLASAVCAHGSGWSAGRCDAGPTERGGTEPCGEPLRLAEGGCRFHPGPRAKS